MASRELKVEIIGDSRSLERALGRAGNSATGFGSKMSKMGKVVGLAALGAGAAITAGFVYTLKRGFDELSESQKVMAQTEAALKSTGGVANVTAKDIEGLATQLSLMSGIDDEAIQANENLLLTFKNVRNEVGKGADIFDRATKASLDLSVAGFGALDSTAKMLGKALNDPIKGMTALGRAGVTFTAGQKETITSLVESGKALEAQKLILQEVESQVGGSAKAYGDTLPGQLAKARNAFDEIAGNLAVKFLPILTRILEWVNANWPTIAAVFDAVGKAVIATFNAIGAAVNWLRTQWEIHRDTIIRVWQVIQQAVQGFIDYVRTNVVPVIRGVINVLVGIWERFGGEIKTVLGLVVLAIKTFVQNAIAPFKILMDLLRGDWSAAWEEAKAVVSRTLGAALAIVKGLVGSFVSAALEIGRGIVSGIFGQLTNIGQKFKASLVDPIVDTLTSAVTAVATAAAKVVLAIIEPFTHLPSFLGAPFRKAKEAIQEQLGIIKTEGGNTARDAGYTIGTFLATGVSAGIAAKAYEVLAAARAIVAQVAAAMAQAAEAKSPSLLTAREVGQPLMEGISLGIGNSVSATSERAYEAVRTVVKNAAKAVRDAKAEFASAFDQLAQAALAAFDAKWADWKPPAQKLLEKMQLEDQIKAVKDRVKAATDELNRLIAESAAASAQRQALGTAPPPGMDPEEWQKQVDAAEAVIKNNGPAILAAQAEVNAALRAQEEFNLQQKAQKQQEAHDKEIAAERTRLEQRLAQLQTWLARHPEEYKKMHAKVAAIMVAFGIDAKKWGNKIGANLADGLREQIGEVAAAAKELADAIMDNLKTKSPAKKGPLSTLDHWWDNFVPTLLKGLDSRRLTTAMTNAVARPVLTGSTAVAGRGGDIHIHVAGSIVTEREVADMVQRHLITKSRVSGELFTRTMGVRV